MRWLRVVRRRSDDQAAAASDGPDPEPEEAQRDLGSNHRRPPVERPEEGRGCRADRAADEVARHERRVDPAAGLLGDSEDPRLVENVECLDRDIHEDDHHDEDGDRVPREDRDDERDKGQRPRRPGGRERPAAVVETPGSLRGDHTDEPDEPEEPDHGHVVGEWRGAEEECQRRPEHRERREGRRPQHHRPPKCPFPSDHGADGSEQCGVFHVRLRSERRNGVVDEDGKHNAGDRCGREDHAPTGCIGDQSAQGARNEDPGQNSRDDDADDAATACRHQRDRRRAERESAPPRSLLPPWQIAIRRTPIDGASAHSVSAAAAQIIITGTRCRRLRTSPSGTIRRIPAA